MNEPLRAAAAQTAGRLGRLVSPQDFARVLTGRRPVVSAHFELFQRRDTDLVDCRLGLAISRKSAPTAVLRNLAKRIAREAGRAAAKQGLDAADYVVRGRALLGKDWLVAKRERRTGVFRATLRAELDTLFGRFNTRRGTP